MCKLRIFSIHPLSAGNGQLSFDLAWNPVVMRPNFLNPAFEDHLVGNVPHPYFYLRLVCFLPVLYVQSPMLLVLCVQSLVLLAPFEGLQAAFQ